MPAYQDFGRISREVYGKAYLPVPRPKLRPIQIVEMQSSNISSKTDPLASTSGDRFSAKDRVADNIAARTIIVSNEPPKEISTGRIATDPAIAALLESKTSTHNPSTDQKFDLPTHPARVHQKTEIAIALPPLNQSPTMPKSTRSAQPPPSVLSSGGSTRHSNSQDRYDDAAEPQIHIKEPDEIQAVAERYHCLPPAAGERLKKYKRTWELRAKIWPHDKRASKTAIKESLDLLPKARRQTHPYAFDSSGKLYAEYEDLHGRSESEPDDKAETECDSPMISVEDDEPIAEHISLSQAEELAAGSGSRNQLGQESQHSMNMAGENAPSLVSREGRKRETVDPSVSDATSVGRQPLNEGSSYKRTRLEGSQDSHDNFPGSSALNGIETPPRLDAGGTIPRNDDEARPFLKPMALNLNRGSHPEIMRAVSVPCLRMSSAVVKNPAFTCRPQYSLANSSRTDSLGDTQHTEQDENSHSARGSQYEISQTAPKCKCNNLHPKLASGAVLNPESISLPDLKTHQFRRNLEQIAVCDGHDETLIYWCICKVVENGWFRGIELRKLLHRQAHFNSPP